MADWSFSIYNHITSKYDAYMETKEIEIPDMVMSMLGVVPSDSIDADDINGRKAYHKHLEEKYKKNNIALP